MVKAIPIADPPPFIPPIRSLSVDGSEQRMSLLFDSLMWNQPQLERSSLVEQLVWCYIPKLSGYMVLVFPPNYDNLPPMNLLSEITGVVLRAEVKQQQPQQQQQVTSSSIASQPQQQATTRRILPFPSSSDNNQCSSNYDTDVYCIRVSSWSQCTDKKIDTRLSPRYLRRRNSKSQKDYIKENVESVASSGTAKSKSTTSGTTTSPQRTGRTGSELFYVFDRETGKLEGKQPLYTKRILPLTPEDKFGSTLFVNRPQYN